jgi:hypothetical protein
VRSALESFGVRAHHPNEAVVRIAILLGIVLFGGACDQPPSLPTASPVVTSPTRSVSASVPVAILTFSPATGTAGVPVTYTMRVEQIPDGDVVQAFRFSLGDTVASSIGGGLASSGPTATLMGHLTMTIPGQYLATATLTLRSGTQVVANAALIVN